MTFTSRLQVQVVSIWDHFSEFWLCHLSVVCGLMCLVDVGFNQFCCAVFCVVLCIIEQLTRNFVLFRWRPVCRGDFEILYTRISMSRWVEKHGKIRCFLNAMTTHMLWVRLLPCSVWFKLQIVRSVGFQVVHTNIFLVYLSKFYVVFDLNCTLCVVLVLKSFTPTYSWLICPNYM